MAEYTRPTLPKERRVSSFSPERRQGPKAKSGRVYTKLCHRQSKPLPNGHASTSIDTRQWTPPDFYELDIIDTMGPTFSLIFSNKSSRSHACKPDHS